MFEMFKKSLFAGLGLAVVTKTKLEKVLEKLVEEGKMSREEAEKMGIEKIAAIHGSPWKYDTYVPIFFAGNGVPAQRISRPVGPQEL